MDPISVTAYITLGTAALDTLFSFLDSVSADPEKRNATLRELSAETEKCHQEALSTLRNNQEQFAKDMERKENEANERLRIQKGTNDEIIQKIQAKIDKQNEKHEETIKKMNKAHEEKMKLLESDTKEAKERAEMEHKMKIEKEEKEHKEKMNTIEEKYDTAVSEGKEKVAKAEKKNEKLTKEKQKRFESFLKNKEDLDHAHSKLVKKIDRRITKFALESKEIERNQSKSEDEMRMNQITKNFQMLLATFESDNIKRVIESYVRITVPVISIKEYLERIKLCCYPLDGSTPSLSNLAVSGDCQKINGYISSFKFYVENYNQHSLNVTTSNTRLRDMCTEMINEMVKLMNRDELRAVCVCLPSAVSEKSQEKVSFYGKKARELCDHFKIMEGKLNDRLQKMNSIHHVTSSNSQPALTN